ncbi:ABC-type cobalamin/Fe3+-siderophores transport system ATPase subunit/ABC-type enterobactin transport system permease subunit [Streptomyces sp. SAI-135]|nr:ABC-type cobalamin/Fe3+-siderophores transport system ATPase subunit/ABC-type enterobactin transport system permease subunit [Streptomyces sp. SAI-135]
MRTNRALRTPGGLSVRLDVRATVAVALILLAALTASVVLIGTGDFPIPAGDVLKTLLGNGDAGQEFIVNELRLPRVLVGLLVGASLGLGGALFQAVSRNPLGSPDVLGLSQGATAGALTMIVLFSGTTAQVTLGALVGGLVTGLAIYVLAWKQGVHGYRLVLVGIGISAIVTAVNGYLLTRSTITEAAQAVVWMTGSLSGRDWAQVWPLLWLCAILVPLVLANGRGLRMMEMGDDVSGALGVRVERVRLLLLVAAVLLTAAATAAAGPVSFVALTAPQLARRLTRSPGPQPAAVPVHGRHPPGHRRPGLAEDLRRRPAARRRGHRSPRRGLPAVAPGHRAQGGPDMNTPRSTRSTVNRLSADTVTLAYDQRVIAEQLSVEIPDNSFTVIVGPNACGKSTLLRALSRMLKPSQGKVLLDGQVIQSMPAKKVARTLGLLPQSSIAPDGITVADLVGRGRYPHQGILRQWSTEDERVVQESMRQTGVAELAERYVDELSGGQRQRVWIAMALAQQTPLLLLDEPTTYLDIQHQIDVLDLCAELHEEQGRTLVAVLHDLNHAARYATHLIALKAGRIIAEGAPNDIVTAELVEEVFGLRCQVIDDPETETPLVVPAARKARARVVAKEAS